jgi:hypothetical protein
VFRGNDNRGNLVPACDECQAERGFIQTWYGAWLEYKKWSLMWWPPTKPQEKSLDRMLQSLADKRERMMELAVKWVVIETARRGKGKSPTMLMLKAFQKDDG